jgi:hypothetical protein
MYFGLHQDNKYVDLRFQSLKKYPLSFLCSAEYQTFEIKIVHLSAKYH